MSHSPPSSGRRVVHMAISDISPTIVSSAMQDVRDQVVQFTITLGRPLALIVNPEEVAESRLFVDTIARTHGLPSPRLLESWKDDVLHLGERQGLLIRRAEGLSPVRFVEVDELIRSKSAHLPFVLSFGSMKQYEAALTDYGKAFWARFHRGTVRWPGLAMREPDWPGVIEQIHRRLHRRDRRPIPRISQEAVAQIISPPPDGVSKMPSTVHHLMRLVLLATELATVADRGEIAAEHVEAARAALREPSRRMNQSVASA